MFPVSTINSAASGTKSTAGHTGKISFVFDFEKGDFVVEDGKVKQCTGDEALMIWVQKCCRTEKKRYRVYDDTQYGIVVEALTVGTRYSRDFVESELRIELEEALLQNEQITGLASFESVYTGNDQLIFKADIITTTNGILTQEVIYSG